MRNENGFVAHHPSLVLGIRTYKTLEENMPVKNLICSSLFLLFVTCGLPILAQTTSVTYQGRLTDAGNPANGQYDFVFRLFDSSGTQIGGDLEKGDVQVTGGVFTVSLNFGVSPFSASAAESLEIGVRPGASAGAYTTLTPRQPLTSEPYAIKSMQALAADTSTNSAELGGIAANQFVVTTDSRMTDARIPTPGSADYVQNRTTQQVLSNFNVSGNGTAGGTISGNVVNAATQFNIFGDRVFSAPGIGNLFAGLIAGGTNTTGTQNSFFGRGSGASNTTASANSFFGWNSGVSNTTGSANSFFGNGSGEQSADGTTNSFFGSGSGTENMTGSGNSFFGVNTGGGAVALNRTGSFNTLMGAFANVIPDGLTNATAIGYRAAVGQNNSLVLGAINGINNATADTNVGIGTTSPATKLHVSGTGIIRARINSDSNAGVALTLSNQPGWSVATANGGHFQIFNDSNGQNVVWIDKTTNLVGIDTTSPNAALDVNGTIRIGTLEVNGTTQLCRENLSGRIASCSSSIRYKQNVQPFSSGLSLIDRLRPVSFRWKSSNEPDLGLVAEDVAKIEPLLVTHNDKGEVEGVKYDRVGVVLINAIKEQQAEIESLKQQVTALKVLVCSKRSKAAVCKK